MGALPFVGVGVGAQQRVHFGQHMAEQQASSLLMFRHVAVQFLFPGESGQLGPFTGADGRHDQLHVALDAQQHFFPAN